MRCVEGCKPPLPKMATRHPHVPDPHKTQNDCRTKQLLTDPTRPINQSSCTDRMNEWTDGRTDGRTTDAWMTRCRWNVELTPTPTQSRSMRHQKKKKTQASKQASKRRTHSLDHRRGLRGAFQRRDPTVLGKQALQVRRGAGGRRRVVSGCC